MNRRKFIGSCTCYAFASTGAVLLNNSRKHIKEDRYCLNNFIEIHLAEHCNLNCKYCRHFSCIAEEEFYNFDKFSQDMKRLSFIFNEKLFGINLMGGEPLLNPRINEYIKITRKYFPKTMINIVTNAVLLDDMDESFWETASENKVEILPSIYPIKINWPSILNKAEKYNVKIYKSGENKEVLTLNNIKKFRKNFFYKTILNEYSQDNSDKSGCMLRECTNMYNGKIYPCPNIAYIRHLNKKFNTNFIVTKDDYIDLYKVKNVSEIEKFIEKKKQYTFCKYCNIKPDKVEWKNSAEHDISEWT